VVFYHLPEGVKYFLLKLRSTGITSLQWVRWQRQNRLILLRGLGRQPPGGAEEEQSFQNVTKLPDGKRRGAGRRALCILVVLFVMIVMGLTIVLYNPVASMNLGLGDTARVYDKKVAGHRCPG
jgi:hypothetical protein